MPRVNYVELSMSRGYWGSHRRLKDFVGAADVRFLGGIFRYLKVFFFFFGNILLLYLKLYKAYCGYW